MTIWLAIALTYAVPVFGIYLWLEVNFKGASK